MAQFPQKPLFRGFNRPQRIECEVFELEYEGQIPAVLNGAFYRCGPDPQFPPLDSNDMGLNGDGFVSRFRFQDGHVDFRQKYVRTDKFNAERKARRALFGAYRNPYTDDSSVAGTDRTTANTSILWYDGRLMACKEDGLPHELDPETLETLRKFNFGGKLRTPTFTAHPKVDPDTGELIFYGYECSGLAAQDAAYCVASASGELVREDWFTLPYPAMIHDFAVTRNYVIFPIMPTTSDLERIKAGGDHWRWNPEGQTLIGVMRRNGSVEDVRYFRGPARWSFHTMNAFEEGGKIHLDTTAAIANAFFNDINGNPGDPAKAPFYLTRWTCDLEGNADAFTERRLYGMPSDFYDVDWRFVGRPYRYGFMAVKDLEKPANKLGGPGSFNSIGRIDHHTGQVDSWFIGEESTLQEPVFVPRGPDAAEGDGYLVAVVNRLKDSHADLVLLHPREQHRGDPGNALFRRRLALREWKNVPADRARIQTGEVPFQRAGAGSRLFPGR
jgi:carotenoid cleavage dioxygenase